MKTKKEIILTANNERVQSYILGNVAPSTNAKKKRMVKFEELVNKVGSFLSELFPCKQAAVLDEIVFLTSGCGICKIGAERLAERADVSLRTVSTAVNKLKKTNQYIVARIDSGHAGKYIFVDKLHANFKEIMNVVFNVDAKQFAYQVACLSPSKNVDTPGTDGENPGSNQYNQFNKTGFIYNNSDSEKNEVVQGIQKEIDNEPVMDLDAQKEQLNQYATNENQHLLFDTMRLFPLHQDIENNLYKLALRVGSNATIKEFHIAKTVIFELNVQLMQATTTIKESAPALFTKMYQEALNAIEQPEANEQPEAASEPGEAPAPTVKFYNWLDERENHDAPAPVQINTPFFYNWLDERED